MSIEYVKYLDLLLDFTLLSKSVNITYTIGSGGFTGFTMKH